MLADTVASLAVEAHRPADRLEQPAHEQRDVALAGDVLAEHDELVTADARDRVARAQDRDDVAGHRHEHRVARIVAEAVVDLLELVEVEEQHRHRPAGSARPGQRRLDAVAEQSPVGQVGQAVVQRGVQQDLLGVAAARRIVEAHQPRAVAGLGQVDGRRDDPDLATERVGETLLGLAVGEERRVGSLCSDVQHRPGDRDGWSSRAAGSARRWPSVIRPVGVDKGAGDRVAFEDRPHRVRSARSRRTTWARRARSSSTSCCVSASTPRGLAQRRAAARLTGQCSVTLRDLRPGWTKFTPSRPG